MLDIVKRTTIGTLAVVTIALIPVVVLAANGFGNAAKPTTTHGPKKTPRPTIVVTPVPTAAPTAAPPLVITPPPTLSPSPTAPGGVVLVGAGDIASCSTSGDTATATLINGIAGTVFTLGDNVYSSGTASEFTNCYDPTWGQFKARTRPAPGNHDYGTAGAAGYFGYFGTAAGEPSKGYYAYDLGAWRVYVLNSNCSAVGGCGAGSAQEAWLRADLASNPRPCVVGMWHHARFSSGTSHGSNTAMQAFWQALYDHDAELVLAGHEHNYERFAPQTATGALDTARGLVELVAGTGGYTHYGFGTPIANSLVRNGTAFGVLKLTLSAGSWSFEFVPVAGETFTDSGTGTCH